MIEPLAWLTAPTEPAATADDSGAAPPACSDTKATTATAATPAIANTPSASRLRLPPVGPDATRTPPSLPGAGRSPSFLGAGTAAARANVGSWPRVAGSHAKTGSA